MPHLVETHIKKRTHYVLMTALGGLLFSLDIPLLKLASSSSAHGLELIFGRGIFLFLMISGWWLFSVWRHNRRASFFHGSFGWVVALSNACASCLFIFAIQNTVASNLVFLLALNPVFCALIGRFVFHERVSGRTWLVIVLCFFGVALIVHDGVQRGHWFGDVLGIFVALCTAISLVAMRYSAQNAVTCLAFGNLLSALFAGALCLFFGVSLFTLSPMHWGWLMLDGIVVVPIAYAMIALGARHLPSPEVAMAFLLETFLAPIWIWLIFSETLGLSVLLGGGVIFCTLLFHSLWLIRTCPMCAGGGKATLQEGNSDTREETEAAVGASKSVPHSNHSRAV